MNDNILKAGELKFTPEAISLQRIIPNIQVGPDPRFLQDIENSRKERERRENENEQNLRISAQNSKEIVDKLQVQINQKDEDLQNQRELIQMLKQQLIGINRTLSDLFIIEEGNQEIQEEANELARLIYASLIQNKKVDLKSVLVDKGTDVLLAAIPIILQIANII
jgi:hypothetical protein